MIRRIIIYVLMIVTGSQLRGSDDSFTIGFSDGSAEKMPSSLASKMGLFEALFLPGGEELSRQTLPLPEEVGNRFLFTLFIGVMQKIDEYSSFIGPRSISEGREFSAELVRMFADVNVADVAQMLYMAAYFQLNEHLEHLLDPLKNLIKEKITDPMFQELYSKGDPEVVATVNRLNTILPKLDQLGILPMPQIFRGRIVIKNALYTGEKIATAEPPVALAPEDESWSQGMISDYGDEVGVLVTAGEIVKAVGEESYRAVNEIEIERKEIAAGEEWDFKTRTVSLYRNGELLKKIEGYVGIAFTAGGRYALLGKRSFEFVGYGVIDREVSEQSLAALDLMHPDRTLIPLGSRLLAYDGNERFVLVVTNNNEIRIVSLDKRSAIRTLSQQQSAPFVADSGCRFKMKNDYALLYRMPQKNSFRYGKNYDAPGIITVLWNDTAQEPFTIHDFFYEENLLVDPAALYIAWRSQDHKKITVRPTGLQGGKPMSIQGIPYPQFRFRADYAGIVINEQPGYWQEYIPLPLRAIVAESFQELSFRAEELLEGLVVRKTKIVPLVLREVYEELPFSIQKELTLEDLSVPSMPSEKPSLWNRIKAAFTRKS